MPLSIIRRHDRKCIKAKNYSIKELDKCLCPLALIGKNRLGQYYDRHAIGTRDKQTAFDLLPSYERGIPPEPPRPKEEEIGTEIEKYREMLRTQKGFKESTIDSYNTTLNALLEFAERKSLKHLSSFTTARLGELIAGWDIVNSTRTTRITKLKDLFGYAEQAKWIGSNPAADIRYPKSGVKRGATRAFDLDEELPKLMEWIPKWETAKKRNRSFRVSPWMKHPRIASALIYVLLVTGLRISDAFLFNPRKLKRMKTNGGKEVWCYFAEQQMKTEMPVFVPIKDQKAAQAIVETEWLSKDYAFWDGKTKLQRWDVLFTQACMHILGRASGVKGVHARRFRATFAVGLLAEGVDIRAVSRLLGHRSLQTTINYYEQLSKRDQDNLVETVLGKRTKVVPIREVA